LSKRFIISVEIVELKSHLDADGDERFEWEFGRLSILELEFVIEFGVED
jgi:hypothetical protein